jgi:hypothetical protein
MHRVSRFFALLVTLGLLTMVGQRGSHAVAQEATPVAGAEDLVSVVVDAGLLTIPSAEVSVGHSVDQPGWRHTISFPTTSVVVVYVASGAYTLLSDGPVVLVKEDAISTPVATSGGFGQAVTAQAGEALVFLSSARNEESNDGSVPTDRYSFLMFGGMPPTIEGEAGTSDGELVAYLDVTQWQPIADGPVTITFGWLDTTAADPTPSAGVQQAVGEVTAIGGATPGRLVVTFTPGTLPGATTVDLPVDQTATPAAT